jgi:hypothetical protein
MISGILRTMDLDINEEQLAKYQSGSGYIQDIFRNLSVDEREFIKTGITAEEWDAFCAEPEE